MNTQLQLIGFEAGTKPQDNLKLLEVLREDYNLSATHFAYLHVRTLQGKPYDVVGELSDGQLRMVVSIRKAVLGTPEAQQALRQILNEIHNIVRGG